MKKFFPKLITNVQPRMSLGQKRFNERSSIESRTEEERQEAATDRRREMGRPDYVSERSTPTEGEIVGPSEHKPR